MGIEDRLALSGTLGGAGRPLLSRFVSTVRVDVDAVVVVVARVVVLDSARLPFDMVRRSVGVSNDSRALGSSNLVYLPIEGL
jgi:hypothetical protein